MTTKQQAKDVLDSVLASDFAGGALTVFLASVGRSAAAPQYQRLQLQQKLGNEFRDILTAHADSLRKMRDENVLRLHRYSLGTKLEGHEVEYLDLEGQNGILQQLAGLAPVTAAPLFEAKKSFISGLRFYVIVLQRGAEAPLYFLRSMSPKFELARSRKFAVWHADGQYDKLEEEVFLFDRRIDVICVGNQVALIHNQFRFNSMLRYVAPAERKADSALKKIKGLEVIKDFAEFRTSCKGNKRLQDKLAKIESKEYLESLQFADLETAITELELDVEIEGVGDERRIVFDPENPWPVLHLLDDDFLTSVMTEINYEASGKRRIDD